ncbi:MAG: PrgI family protein [Roseburia sp.]|nr:PrgI family protein [Roseburia sp.]
MTKQINQDVAAFKDDFFKGLSIRECIYGGAALIAGTTVILSLIFLFDKNINFAITVGIPFIGIIGLCGFYQKNGMTLPMIVKRQISIMRQKPLTYRTVRLDDAGRYIREQKENEAKGLEGFLVWLDKRRVMKNG